MDKRDIRYDNDPIDALLDVNNRIEGLENERNGIIVQAIIDFGKQQPREWLTDDIDFEVAAIQIYYKNVFIEIRYILPENAAEYLSVKIFNKGVYQVFSLYEVKVDVMEEHFMPRLFEAIDKGIDLLKGNNLLEE